MILTQKQIEEIEQTENHLLGRAAVEQLIETVKHLQAKEQKSMELLEAGRRIMRHWEVGHELQNQIEEHLK